MDNRLLAFAHLARTVAERVLPERAHKFAPKRYTQPQLLACLLLQEHLGLDYRTAQELLALSDALRDALGLRRVPDHSTLWWFAQHKVTPELIERALAETVGLVREAERDVPPPGPAPPAGERPERVLPCVALDSTGLWTSHASRYFEWRRAQAQRRGREQRSWQKWAALWTGPQLVVAQRVRPGPCGDFSDLIPPARAAHAVLPFERLLADAGYDSEGDDRSSRNHAFCREVLDAESLIPAKKRRSARVVARTPYRSEMVRALGCEALGIAGDPVKRRAYGQRWKAETLMSVVKRKWGEALSARKGEMQALQALLRGLVYNLYRLVVLGYRPGLT